MKRVTIFVLLFSLTFIPPLSADPGKGDVWEAANSEVYQTKFGGMLGRGFLNVVTSFVDVIVHTVERTKEGPPLIGTLTGIASGAGCTTLRAASGALDLTTFWVPGFNGFPVSRSYTNCLDFGEGVAPVETEEFPAPAFEEPAPPAPKRAPESYAKPAAPKRDVYDYVKK